MVKIAVFGEALGIKDSAQNTNNFFIELFKQKNFSIFRQEKSLPYIIKTQMQGISQRILQ